MVAPFFIPALVLAGFALCALTNALVSWRGRTITTLGHVALAGVAAVLAAVLLAAAVRAL